VPALAAGSDVSVRLDTVPERRGRLVWTGATIARPEELTEDGHTEGWKKALREAAAGWRAP